MMLCQHIEQLKGCIDLMTYYGAGTTVVYVVVLPQARKNCLAFWQ
jgi:hypothetical protein